MTMHDSSIVSLVVTCFNQGRYLAQAIDSALAQSTPFAEIIVVDDGSTDETCAVAARYPQVRYLGLANRGLSAARNAGARAASSLYVVFLDADDRLCEQAVAAGLECCLRAPACAFVYGHFRCVAEDGTPQATPAFQPCPEDAYSGFLRHNLVGMHATVMYRRDVLLEAGGFDESLPACEDYELYLRLARRHRVSSHDRVIAEYRKHGENLSNDHRLMLTTVQGVLQRQQPVARGDPALRAALDEGARNWQQYYGSRLAVQALLELRQPGRRRRGLADLATVLARAPRGLRTDDFDILRVAARACMRYVPAPVRRRALSRWTRLGYAPPPGSVQMGDLRRLTPLSRVFGFDRGRPIDRYYIEHFLGAHAGEVRGRVLEVGDRAYTDRFGAGRVVTSDVLNVKAGNPLTTIVADLTQGDGIPDATFDCIILTQTLHLIFDLDAAVATLYRILKPGGTLLLTVPGTISQVASDTWRTSWRWGFTPLVLRELFGRVFPVESTWVSEYGNVLSSVGFLEGMAAGELTRAELDHRDESYPLLIGLCVRKPS